MIFPNSNLSVLFCASYSDASSRNVVYRPRTEQRWPRHVLSTCLRPSRHRRRQPWPCTACHRSTSPAPPSDSTHPRCLFKPKFHYADLPETSPDGVMEFGLCLTLLTSLSPCRPAVFIVTYNIEISCSLFFDVF